MPRVFSDDAGTTPATYGGSVARIDDIGPNGRNVVQANGALRPLLGRAPAAGVRNLLTWSEDFTNAAWTKANGVVTTANEHMVLTANAASGVTVRLAQTGVPLNGPRGLYFELKAGTHSRIQIIIAASISTSGAEPAAAIFDLTAGTVINQNGDVATITALGDGWYRCFIASSLNGVNSGVVCGMVNPAATVPASSGSINHTWAGTETVLIRKAQFELSLTATPYQRVTNALDVTEAGFTSPGFLRFDLSDDVMPVEFPGGFDGDLLIFGRNGSWVQEGVTVAPAGTLDIGPRSVPDAPAGLLAALGDIVAWLPVGRTTTAAERARMRTYYQPRGAAGYLTVGPETITNGDFAADSDWTKGTDWTIGSGVATKTAGTAAGLDQALTLTPGARYLLTFTMTRTAGTLTPQFISGTTVSGIGRTASGTYAQVLTAVTGNNALRFNGNATFAGTVDDVSLRELTVGA